MVPLLKSLQDAFKVGAPRIFCLSGLFDFFQPGVLFLENTQSSVNLHLRQVTEACAKKLVGFGGKVRN